MVMADCSFTKIAVMQIFYELKQKFPAIPDYVVSDCIQRNSYDKEACELHLAQESEKYQLHCYPSGIVHKMSEGKEKCRPKSLCLQKKENTTSDFFKRHGFGRQSLDSKISDQYNIIDHRDPEGDKFHSGKRFGSLSVNDIRKSDKINCCSYGGSVPINLNVNNSLHECENEQFESVKDIEVSTNDKNLFLSHFKLNFRNDNRGSERTRLQVKYKKGQASYSTPTTPSAHHRSFSDNNTDNQSNNNIKRTSSLYIDRVLPVNKLCDPKRPFTSVTLTLRPASSEQQTPIDISTKGSKLTYSTCSYDAKRGYQNELQISINEEGNTTLSASSMRTTSSIPDSNDESSNSDESPVLNLDPEIPPVVKLRLQEQIDAKRRLERELDREKTKLEKMEKEVAVMEREIERRTRMPLSQRVIQLRNEVRVLQVKCTELINQIDVSTVTSVPLGEVNEDFYNDIPMTSDISHNPSSSVAQLAIDGENANWTCHMCTFRNHPMLPKCEQCEMARVDLSNALANILRPPTTTPHRTTIHPKV